MADALLVLNAGSSSLKFSLYTAHSLDLRLRGAIEGIEGKTCFYAHDSRGTRLGEQSWDRPLGHGEALAFLLDFLPGAAAYDTLAAVGHRVVHGGRDYPEPVRVDAGVLAALDKLVPLAPLHQPHNLASIRAITALHPALPQVACFDTSFHRVQPAAHALPPSITSSGAQRYGFHGLSCEYVASVLPEFDARAAAGRTIVAHLGAGSSLSALSAGRGIATAEGFSAVDGLPGDMRELIASDRPSARAAIDLYVYRIGREIGSLAAALGGLDALVFTAGIGAHQPAVRAGVCAAVAWPDLDIDADANESGGPRISSEASGVTAWVIPADEEIMIARHTQDTLREQ